MRVEGLLQFHARMLADGERMRAYADAIARAVHPGDVVVDLGTGTGVLAMLAARAGASCVIGIDREERILRQARELARDNGLSDRVEFVHADVLKLTASPVGGPVDVVMSELIGNQGIDENIMAIHAHFLRLLPRPPRVCIPGVVRLHAACMDFPEFSARLHALREVCGLRFDRLAEALSRTKVVMPLPAGSVSPPAELYAGRPGFDELPDVFTAVWEFGAPCRFDGVGLWFSSHLAEGVELTNAPESGATHWSQCFFPVRLDGPVQGTVRFELWPRMLGGVPQWKWRLSWTGGAFVGDPDAIDSPDSVEAWLENWHVVMPKA